MIALILNSGLGSRMGQFTKSKHKSMVEIAENYTLIYYQIEVLAKNGVKDFVITTGYMKEKLIKHIRNHFGTQFNIEFVDNPLYLTTNYIYSMYLALEKLQNEDVLLLHGDLYFDSRIIPQIFISQPSCLIVDSSQKLPEKDFKAEVENGLINKVATYIFNNNCLACQPFYKLNREDWHLWADAIRSFCKSGRTNVYAEEALNTILDKMELRALDINGKLCMEVDTPNDLFLLKTRIEKEGTLSE